MNTANTAMMTVCNILNQQLGASSVDKTKTPNMGDAPYMPDAHSQNLDRSYNNESGGRIAIPNQDNKSAFNHKLAEKINAQTGGCVSLGCKQVSEKKEEKTASLADIPIPIAAPNAVPASLDVAAVQPVEQTDELSTLNNYSKSGKQIAAEALTRQIPDSSPAVKTVISNSSKPVKDWMPVVSDSVPTTDGSRSDNLQKPLFTGYESRLTAGNDRMPAMHSDSQSARLLDSPADQESTDQMKSAGLSDDITQLHRIRFKHNATPDKIAPEKMVQDSVHTEQQKQGTPSKAVNAESDAHPSVLIESSKSEDENNLILAKTAVQKLNIAAEQIKPLYAEKSQTAKDEFRLKPASDNHNLIQGSDLVAGKNPVQTEDGLPRPVQSIHSFLGLGRQIQESVAVFYRHGMRQIVIRLDPPELGRVTIKFIEHHNDITGILHVEKSQTKQEIQQILPELLLNLQSSDVSIKKLEVALSSHQNNVAQEHSARDNGSTGQEYQHNTVGPSSEEWSSQNDAGPEHGDGLSQMRLEVSDKTINLLA